MEIFSDGESPRACLHRLQWLLTPRRGSGSPHIVVKVSGTRVEGEGWKCLYVAGWKIYREVLYLVERKDAPTSECWGIPAAHKVPAGAKTCKQPGAFKSNIPLPPSQEWWSGSFLVSGSPSAGAGLHLSHTPPRLGSLTLGEATMSQWGWGTRTFPVRCAWPCHGVIGCCDESVHGGSAADQGGCSWEYLQSRRWPGINSICFRSRECAACVV